MNILAKKEIWEVLLMGNQVAKRLGNVASSVFSEIGNSFNPSLFIKPYELFSITKIKNDKEALSQDWNAVCEEVEVAIARFKETYRSGFSPSRPISRRK